MEKTTKLSAMDRLELLRDDLDPLHYLRELRRIQKREAGERVPDRATYNLDDKTIALLKTLDESAPIRDDKPHYNIYPFHPPKPKDGETIDLGLSPNPVRYPWIKDEHAKHMTSEDEDKKSDSSHDIFIRDLLNMISIDVAVKKQESRRLEERKESGGGDSHSLKSTSPVPRVTEDPEVENTTVLREQNGDQVAEESESEAENCGSYVEDDGFSFSDFEQAMQDTEDWVNALEIEFEEYMVWDDVLAQQGGEKGQEKMH